MLKCRKSLLAVTVSAVALVGCLDDANQSKNVGAELQIPNSQIQTGTHPVYNPVETTFPLPEDALFFINEDNDGTALNGTDPANPVTQGLGFMDGTSVLSPFDIKISASLDTSQTLDARPFVEGEGDLDGVVIPNPDQNVFLLPLEYAGGDSLMTGDGEVPGLTQMNDYRRAQFLEDRGDITEANEIFERLLTEPPVRLELISVDGGSNNAIRILPESPLAAKTKYAVALSNDLRDSEGRRLVGSPSYQSISNPARVLTNPLVQPFRDSAAPARQQITDLNQFKREFFSEQSLEQPVSLPGFDDIVYSATFTTTAIEDVLLANAVPATFFRDTLSIELRQQEIERLVSGFYNVSEQPLASEASDNERAINRRIFSLLTDEDQEFRLFDPVFAERLVDARNKRERISFAAFSRDNDGNLNRFAAIAMQTAVAEAAEEVLGADAESRADELALAAQQLEGVLDLPQGRTVTIFRQRDGSEINAALGQTGEVAGVEVDVDIRVFEGEITLPYYMGLPEDELDGVAIQGSNWSAADFGPNVDLPLAISERISYRFPFPRKTGMVTVPIVVTMPDTAAGVDLPLLGSPVITEPGDGFPVIIYQPALTQDRSAILPMAVATGLLCAAQDTIDDCFVTIAIDPPLHGIFEGQEGAVGLNAITEQGEASPEAQERHFGFAANPAMSAVPADTLEEPESGSLFLNFTNFANTLGNMRQSTMDMLNVNASLGNIEQAIADCANCDDDFDIDPSRIFFLTHSLSGMGGVSVPHIINRAIVEGNETLTPIAGQGFLNTGGHFTRTFENSHDLAAQLLPGLDAASEGLLAQGRTELNLYLHILQGIVDGVDPANYAGSYAGSNTLLTAIVGDPAIQDDQEVLAQCTSMEEDRVTADCTVPNSADDTLFVRGPLQRDGVMQEDGTAFDIRSLRAPMAGTEPFAALMGAVNVLELGGETGPFISLFREGSHGNPISAGQGDLDPGSSEAAFTVTAVQLMEIFQDPRVAPSTSVDDDDGGDFGDALVSDDERITDD